MRGGSPRMARTAADSWGNAVMIPTVGVGAPSWLISPWLLISRTLTVSPEPTTEPTTLPPMLTLWVIGPPEGGRGPGDGRGLGVSGAGLGSYRGRAEA